MRCPEGEAYLLRRRACVPCEPGTYSPLPGAEACLPCAAGTAQPNASADVCITCLEGTYSDPGSPVCLPCPDGTASGLAGQSSCPCDLGFYFEKTEAFLRLEAERERRARSGSRCAHEAGWTYVLDYFDDPHTRDLPNSSAAIVSLML